MDHFLLRREKESEFENGEEEEREGLVRKEGNGMREEAVQELPRVSISGDTSETADSSLETCVEGPARPAQPGSQPAVTENGVLAGEDLQMREIS